MVFSIIVRIIPLVNMINISYNDRHDDLRLLLQQINALLRVLIIGNTDNVNKSLINLKLDINVGNLG